MIINRWFLVLTSILVLAACGDKGTPDEAGVAADESDQSAAASAADATAEFTALTDSFMAQMAEDNAYFKLISGERVTKLPDNTLAYVQEAADKTREMLDKLGNIDTTALSHQDQLSAAMLQHQLELAIEAPRHYWTGFDVTPYTGGFVFTSLLTPALQGASFDTAEDVEAYLGLISDVGRYISDQLVKLKGQRERGILIPKAAIPGVRAVYTGLRSVLPATAAVTEARQSNLDSAAAATLNSGISARIDNDVYPAVDALLGYLDEAYEAEAPFSVGLGQYPGGKAAYAHAIRQQTTLSLSPEEIHQIGLDSLARIREEMQAIRDELGFEGTQEEFHEAMRNDPNMYAKTPQEVEERYMAYVRQIEPLVSDYFSVLPKAPYGVARLAPAAEPGMTFGYYSVPNATSEKGIYYYNGSKLDERPMVWTAGLIFHELIPGHHFHLALQNENEDLSEFRKKTSTYAAFTEGWANYAASLGAEMGLMDDPMERYGWLLFDAFISTRLVLDTGMNALGWPLEKARQFMLENTFSSETEVATETLRYSTDMPAQALAYKLGFEKIKEYRRNAEEQLGDGFDIKAFHAAAVGSGAMPMPILKWHIEKSLGLEE